MTAVQALFLGLIQGLAEFLPVSSSGHLVLLKTILGLEEVPMLFDIILHLATLLVVVIVFRARIGLILEALWKWTTGELRKGAPKTEPRTPKERKHRADLGESLAFVVPVLIATAITAVLGFAIEKYVPMGGVKAVAARMLVTAVVLGLTAVVKPGLRTATGLDPARAAFIGLAQGIGVFSGISRSGITISAGIFAGLDRGTAGELSFLLAIPAILGAFVLSLGDAGQMMASVSFGNLALAFCTAFLSGYAALKFLLGVIKRGKMFWFAPYMLVAGALGLILG